MEWSDVVAQLSGLAHMATVTERGRPHVSVVSPTVVDGTIWIGTKLSSRKARNVRAKPHASLVWQPGAEIYLDADVELVSDLKIKRTLWEGGAFDYDPATFFGSADNPDFVLLRLTPRAASIMEMGEMGTHVRRWRDNGPV